jgi:lipopolysaccharide transport protein LptA
MCSDHESSLVPIRNPGTGFCREAANAPNPKQGLHRRSHSRAGWKRWVVALWIWAIATTPWAAEHKPDEPILIKATKAWESEDKEILYLEGDFHMYTSEWEVRAERAEVHGPVEDPEKIIGYGKPASIRVTLGKKEGEGIGYSNRIVYLYRKKLLELHDGARMEMDHVTVRSAAIIYDVANKRLVSGGAEGVEFVLQPEDSAAR